MEEVKLVVKNNKPHLFGGTGDIIPPENIGWVRVSYIEEPKRIPITDEHIAKILANDGICHIETIPVCTNYGGSHLNKDCSCKSGFEERLLFIDNKIVIYI